MTYYDPLGDDDNTDAVERRAIVAWLRRWADTHPFGVGYGSIGDSALRQAADKIEAAEHHQEHP